MKTRNRPIVSPRRVSALAASTVTSFIGCLQLAALELGALQLPAQLARTGSSRRLANLE